MCHENVQSLPYGLSTLQAAKFAPWVVDLAGGKKSTAHLLRLSETSLSLKKCHMIWGWWLHYFRKLPLIKTANVVGE